MQVDRWQGGRGDKAACTACVVRDTYSLCTCAASGIMHCDVSPTPHHSPHFPPTSWPVPVLLQPTRVPSLSCCLPLLPMFPSAQNAKYAVTRDVLPDGTVVPQGTQVIYSAYVVNRLQSVWGPDALSFRPERWLEMDKAPSPYTYLTFNAGGLCVGGGRGGSERGGAGWSTGR